MTKSTALNKTFERLHTLRTQTSWAAPLLARVTLGGLFISTGWGKVHNLAKVTAFFAELGIPHPALQATLVSYVELIGGSLLLLGVATEFAAMPLIVTMTVAIITAKRDEIQSVADLFGLAEWTTLVLLFWVVFVGAGKVSFDGWLHRRARPESQKTSSSMRELEAARSAR